jgi:tripartite-type tricarboxylate transporter receptor subunit TctC
MRIDGDEMAINRRTVIKGLGWSAAAPLIALPRVARGQGAYPNRPVRFIVPLAAGGGLDFVARIVGEYLSRGLGQQVYIENRTGAGGTIGIDMAIQAQPDGYSLLVTNDNVASAPHVMRLNTDYLKNLMPVSLIGRQPQVLAVHPSFDVKTVAEMVAEVKKVGTMGCATSGVGSNQHVLMEWFSKVAGVKLEHVPYRGAGQAINDLLAGHVKVAFLGPTAVLPHANAGKIRILAQSGETRSPSLPDAPTLVETGYKDVTLESWYAAFAPLGTPEAIVARLNAELEKALADPATQAAFQKGATDTAGGPPEKLAAAARADSVKYERLVRELNIKLS